MIGRGTVGQAIGVARWDVERIQDAQTILQIADAGRQGEGNGRRQIAPRTPDAVAPCLLALGKVQTLQGLLHPLVAGEAGPFVVAGGTIHGVIVAATPGQVTGDQWLPLPARGRASHEGWVGGEAGPSKMRMMQVNLHDAKTHLSRDDQAVAGEEVVIARAGKPLVRLVPVEPQRPLERRGGFLRGQVVSTSDLKADFKDDIEAMFSGD
jgi:antitoxin (DNA-binding transcriptional repressor) of toxin-antitoxin stability system